jgi:ubiquitin C-terminal hydrolase
MNPLFIGLQANNSKDLVNFIIMTLHQELNRASPNNSSNLKKNNLQIDQTNESIILNAFATSFAEENMSIISDIFYAIQKTNTKCSCCNLIKYNFQAYFFLVFPLEEIRKYKIQLLQNQFNINNQNFMNINPILYKQNLLMFQANLQNINSVDFNDCFLNNQKTEYFTGANKSYCNLCKQTCDSLYTNKIFSSPIVLIIILNRGKGNIYDVQLNFDEYIDITNFVLQKDTPRIIYNLYGVITHIGQNGPNAHFVASCKCSIDNK